MRVRSRSSSIATVSVTISRRPPDGIDESAVIVGSMICARAHGGSRCVVAPVALRSRSTIPASRTGESDESRSIDRMVMPSVRANPLRFALRFRWDGPIELHRKQGGVGRKRSSGPAGRGRPLDCVNSAQAGSPGCRWSVMATDQLPSHPWVTWRARMVGGTGPAAISRTARRHDVRRRARRGRVDARAVRAGHRLDLDCRPSDAASPSPPTAPGRCEHGLIPRPSTATNSVVQAGKVDLPGEQ